MIILYNKIFMVNIALYIKQIRYKIHSNYLILEEIDFQKFRTLNFITNIN